MLEAITQPEFDERLESDELKLCFVGMSNCGKSWSAKRMVSELGFRRIDCDGLIQEDLDEMLLREGYLADGVEPLEAMAAWMGQPPDERFAEREAEYLRLEQLKMEQVIEELATGKQHKNTIIDTTGSIAHVAPKIRNDLSSLATVVLFSITGTMQEAMYQKYREDPKPLVWDGVYQPLPGETSDETLERCYGRLLNKRSSRYHNMAHVVIPREVKFEFQDQTELLGHIREALPEA